MKTNKTELLDKYRLKYDLFYSFSKDKLFIYEPIFVNELDELHKCFKNIVVRSEK